MSNLSGNGPSTEFKTRPLPDARRNAWLMPSAIVAAIIVIGLGYGSSNGWMSSATTERRAATTDGSVAPMSPAPAAPASTPKP